MTSGAELCRRMPCVVCWRPNATDVVPDVSALVGAGRTFGKSSGFSVPTRGAGGTVPLCQAHHQEWHSIGEAEFDTRHGLDLRAVAEAIRLVRAGQTAEGKLRAAEEAAATSVFEPFCACGRRHSDCDGSRKGCCHRG